MSESFPPPSSSESFPPPQPSTSSAKLPVPGKTLGIVAFVLSFFLQLVALILGIVALVQSRKAGRGNGFAVAAIILSIVFGLAWIVGGILLFVGAASFGLDALQQCQQLGESGTITVAGQPVACSQILDGQ